MNNTPPASGLPARASRHRRMQACARRGKRLALASFSAVAMTALGTALGTPAMAATGPSMILNNNATNIAVQGPHNTLKYYWAINGTATWHPETVAGKNSTYSAPSMILNNNAVNITAMGPRHRLKYYWAINGTTTWHPETVAGKGSVR